MEKKINLFEPVFEVEEILCQIKECLNRGWTGLGFKTVEFENEWKNYSGLKNAHYLNSNTAGLHLAVNILKKKYKWEDGDEILTTPITFVSTNHVILYEKLKPVFCDVDEYVCIDPSSVIEKINSKTKAIIFVGIGGNTGRFYDIIDICKKRDIKIILDAAHMAGTKYNNEHVGGNCDASIFSFQAVKNLPTGDSGMICFNDNELDIVARKLSWLGIDKDTYSRVVDGKYSWKYSVNDIGFKYHGNSVMASIGLIQLKYLERDNEKRNHISNLYNYLLKEIKEVNPIKVHPNCISSRHLYQIRIKQRDSLLEFLKSKNIFPGVHYAINTDYPMYSYAKNTCPNAEIIAKEILTLPAHLKLSDDDILYIVNFIKEFFK